MENRSLIFDNLDRGCFQETIIEIICASERGTNIKIWEEHVGEKGD